jgi:sugar phosphate isomerase/epimerase
MAIACSTSAFKAPLEEALEKIAAMGFEAVDLIAIPGWGHVMPDACAADPSGTAGNLRHLLDARGLTPVAMNVALPHMHQREAETVATRKTLADGVCKVMRELGVAVASFYPGYKAEDRPWDDVLADSVASMREVLEIAERYGVVFAVELHFATPFETIEQCTRLLEAIPELPVAYDPSHFAMQSIPMPETAPLLDRAAHVHLRDAGPDAMQQPMGEGTVDFDWIVETLQARGYAGQYSIEYLPKLEGPQLSQSITDLKNLLERKL